MNFKRSQEHFHGLGVSSLSTSLNGNNDFVMNRMDYDGSQPKRRKMSR